MDNRLKLHEKLCEIINITESNGDRHVYFQPPSSIKMKYPAIRYSFDEMKNNHANNGIYKNKRGYSITLIDADPDNGFVDKILEIPYCRFGNSYIADNLNHYTFTIYI